ncbi:MAG: response regulator [Lachnospiraceae bacterium]|nr:response regulator [Lachnospiraceae bacterium]
MYRFIIIDDEEIIRKGTVKKLKDLSDRIECAGEAGDGVEGLRIIKEQSPDFVILDMQMPNMDGMALLPALAKEYPDLPLLVISGFKDFDYIKQAISSNAIEYILKPFSKETIQSNVLKIIDILETRQKLDGQILNSQQQKENAYYEYDLKQLTDQMMGYHNDDITLNSARLSIFNSNYNYILMSIHFEEGTKRPDISKWLMDSGRNDLSVYIEPSGSTLGLLLLFYPGNRTIEEYRVLRPVRGPITDYLISEKTDAMIGVSRVHSALTELNDAFTEAGMALNMQPVSSDELQIFDYEEDLSPHRLFWDRQDEFLFRLEAGMKDEMLSLLNSLFSLYETNADARFMDLKYHCRKLSDECVKVVSMYLDYDGQVENSNSMQQIVNQIYSKQELYNYYSVFFGNLTMLLSNRSVYSTDDNIEKVQTYINRNYQKNINQELLSSYFYINRSYLSTLFKERTGEKFVDYLNRVRIEKSVELLTTTNMKMYQIAKNVGYDNVKYFFKIFKKVMGVTPEAYREEHT